MLRWTALVVAVPAATAFATVLEPMFVLCCRLRTPVRSPLAWTCVAEQSRLSVSAVAGAIGQTFEPPAAVVAAALAVVAPAVTTNELPEFVVVREPVVHVTSVGHRCCWNVPVVEEGSLSTDTDFVMPPTVLVDPPAVRSTSEDCHDACACTICSCWTLEDATGPRRPASTVP